MGSKDDVFFWELLRRETKEHQEIVEEFRKTAGMMEDTLANISTMLLAMRNCGNCKHEDLCCSSEDGLSKCDSHGGWLSAWEWNEGGELAKKAAEEAERVDWASVPVDTKILVRDNDREKWQRRHLSRYENGTVYTWTGGETSFTTEEFSDTETKWRFAKLYKEEKENGQD